eukprot:TRINITY_DN11518_c0_g1_i1.p2 TRINITY_DN11518_c0_g1~~TRINITY_DN11518_c0_g1_i1.p2  ORF type:complete len:619 (+),score=212.81 TRINITY_DN11518_c0_g1_i1:234-1859(+)
MVALKGRYQRRMCPPPRGVAATLDTYFVVPLTLSWCELAVSLWIIGWLVLCFLYVWNHAHINNLVGPTGRGFGGVVCGILTLQLFPVSKTSVLLWTFGIPFERALRFHTRLGTWALLMTLAHFVGMLAQHGIYYSYGEPLRDITGRFTGQYAPGRSASASAEKAWDRMVAWNIGFPHGPPLAGLFCFIIQLCIAGGALLRRRHYNAFVMTHLLYAVLYPMAWIHYPTLMVFTGVPVVLYVLDVAIQTWASHRDPAEVVEVTPFSAGITRVLLKKRNFSYTPGQWVHVRIPQLDGAVPETHPFSVSSVQYGDAFQSDQPSFKKGGSTAYFTIHCKSQGEGQWTGRLRSVNPGASAVVNGPYGKLMFDEHSVRHLFLFAGGVGVTPLLGYLSHLQGKAARGEASRCKYVTFVWSYRGEDVYNAFRQEIERAMASAGPDVEWNFFNTAGKRPATPPGPAVGNPIDAVFRTPLTNPLGSEGAASRKPSGASYRAGRPEWSTYLRAASEYSAEAACFACGPGPVVRDVTAEALSAGIPLHTEVFEF